MAFGETHFNEQRDPTVTAVDDDDLLWTVES